ncbi:MAG: signal peptidase I [Armatimonadetes bacterium]|nr:signal peptidase I [Armatimonadota bacterium]
MSITERLANLNTWTVIITVLVLFALRFALLKFKTPTAKSLAEIAESLGVAMALVFLLIRPFLVQAFFIPSASMHPTLLEHDHILVNKLIYRLREPKLGDVVVFKAPLGATPGKTKEQDFIKRVVAVPGDTVRITPGYVLVDGVQYDHRVLGNHLSSFSSSNEDHAVKLFKDEVRVDGQVVTKPEVASALGRPNGKVKIVPGVVYLNGKALKEHYIAEDPDQPYPMSNTPMEWIVTRKDSGERAQYVKIPKDKLLVMGDNRNDSNDARFWGLLERNRLLGKAMFIFWPVTRVRLIH